MDLFQIFNQKKMAVFLFFKLLRSEVSDLAIFVFFYFLLELLTYVFYVYEQAVKNVQ